MTIIGAIGGNRNRDHLVWSYKIVDKTVKENVVAFLDQLMADAGVP